MDDTTVCMPDFKTFTPVQLLAWLRTHCIEAELVKREYGVVLWLEFIDFNGLYQSVESDTVNGEVLSDACDMVYILQNSGEHAI